MEEEQGDNLCTVHEAQRGLVIEAGCAKDLEEMLRIEQASFSAPWTRKMMQGELNGNPFAFFAVARRSPGVGVVAYACYWIVFDELRVMNLAVDPEARREGIATALVRHMLETGRRRGAKRAVLEVRASNRSALNLYERFGFQHVAVRKQYYSLPVEDAAIMELDLLQATG